MINNRQNGRRRGRGGGGGGNSGPRQGGGQGRADNGNRIDNRARGNANQLLEKYRNLAADAQRQGDRVNTEYYLQFADHYFRVLADQRGRMEEQQPRRQQNDFDGDGDEDYGDEGEPIRAGEQQMVDGDERPQQQPRSDNGQRRERGNWNDRNERADRGDRNDRGDRGERQPRRARDDREEEVAGQHRADPPLAGESLDGRAEAVLEADAPLAAPARRRGRPRRDEQQPDGNGVDAERLPPSFGIAAANDAAPADAKPRRRRLPTRAAEAPDAAE